MNRDANVCRQLDPAVVLAACCVAHVAAAAFMYHRLAPELPVALRAASNPAHLLGMARGLRRFLALDLFAPPIVPVLSAALVAYAGLPSSTTRGVEWLALGFVPPAAESLARAATVAVAPMPGSVADLLSLPERFSSGVLPVLDWLGTDLSRGARYWAATVTVAMGCSVYCWGRALALSPMARLLRAPVRSGASDVPGAGIAVAVAGGLYVAVAAAVQLAIPAVVQLFVMLTG